MAELAEASGWDGVFTWDGISVGQVDTYDPWVVMAAMAMRTDRVTLGAIITPPSRRRPWECPRTDSARSALERPSRAPGRARCASMTPASGMSASQTDTRTRASCSTSRSRSSRDYARRAVRLRGSPLPIRQVYVPADARPAARIRIWVVGAWPSERSMRRTLRYDGVVTQVGSAEEVAAIADWVRRGRPEPGGAGLRYRRAGTTSRRPGCRRRDRVRPYADAGATWWLDADWDKGTVK